MMFADALAINLQTLFAISNFQYNEQNRIFGNLRKYGFVLLFNFMCSYIVKNNIEAFF